MSVDAGPARPSLPESCEVHSESWEECEYHLRRAPFVRAAHARRSAQ
jgi:hypothetical protein